MSADVLLATIVDTIVGLCAPDEIRLFGSWAKGSAHRHSDVDILVIGPFAESRWIRSRAVEEALRELPVGVDLHMLTPKEYVAGRSQPHGYLSTLGPTSVCLFRSVTVASEGA